MQAVDRGKNRHVNESGGHVDARDMGVGATFLGVWGPSAPLLAASSVMMRMFNGCRFAPGITVICKLTRRVETRTRGIHTHELIEPR